MSSNHSRLACAARCVDSTTGLRSSSYAASADSRPAASPTGCSCRHAASASASSMASLVPEPIEKCAVCAASPISTTLPWRQVSLRTVRKLSQLELFANTRWPSRRSANSSRTSAIDVSSLCARPAVGRGDRAERPRPDVVVHLDDERAGALVVRVPVELHDAVRGLPDVERERLEHEVGAQPHVLAAPGLEGGREHVGERRAHPGAGAVTGHDQVVLRGEPHRVGGRGPEPHRHAQLGAAALQDSQQRLAAHGGEAVAARGGDRAPVVHVDVVPARDVALHLRRRPPGRRARCRRGSRRRTPRRSRTCRRRRSAPRR